MTIDTPTLLATPLGVFNGIEAVHRYYIDTEDGDHILTESGDKIETEP